MSARTVVLADDNADVRQLVRHHLESKGAFEVEEAVDGYDALLLISGLLDTPDAVVLDHRMPGITGLETADRLRHRLPGVPLILYSAYLDDDGVRAEAGRLGVSACVAKEDYATLPGLIGSLGDESDPVAPEKGFGPAPYGWRRVPASLEPDPGEQAILRAILRAHDAGGSYRSIAKSLDGAGHRGRRSGTWSATQVSRIVRQHRSPVSAE